MKGSGIKQHRETNRNLRKGEAQLWRDREEKLREEKRGQDNNERKEKR